MALKCLECDGRPTTTADWDYCSFCVGSGFRLRECHQCGHLGKGVFCSRGCFREHQEALDEPVTYGDRLWYGGLATTTPTYSATMRMPDDP